MSQEQVFADWKDREALAEAMIPLIGKIYREANVEVSVYGHSVVNRSVISILKSHRAARHLEKQQVSVVDTYPVIEAMQNLNLANVHVDIGKLAMGYQAHGGELSLADYVAQELTQAVNADSNKTQTDVVLYGFGRIGRLLARLLIDKTGGGQSLRLRAIVVRKGSENDLQKRANLLRRDSVHSNFQGTITVDQSNNTIIANGNVIQVIYASSPEAIDYTDYNISNAVIIDNTGLWRDEEGLSLHLQAKGASKVLLTAPGKGIKNIVMGVNQADIEDTDTILSAASCTTNAITPVLKALHDRYGVANGHVETVHAYTNDQNLIDNYHKGDRRGRAAGLNMVLTETGAAKAVAKALPAMEGKLTGNAIRVPTPNVSMAILNLNLEREVQRDELNDYLRDTAIYSDLQKQIDFTTSREAVSSDFVGSRAAGVVDGLATIAGGSKSCVVYVWYDNEFGYSCQVVRMLQHITKTALPAFPITK